MDAGIDVSQDVSQDDDSTSESNVQKTYKRRLLQGLDKIRKIGQRSNVKIRIQGLRTMRASNDKEQMRLFVYYALRHMIPSNTWNTSKANTHISHLFSIHDEAFALLIMMNNWSV